MWKTAFKKFEGMWFALSKPYPFKFFKGCFPLVFFGPFLNTLSHIRLLGHALETFECFLYARFVQEEYIMPNFSH